MHNNIISITVHQTVVYINKLKAQKIKKTHCSVQENQAQTVFNKPKRDYVEVMQ